MAFFQPTEIYQEAQNVDAVLGGNFLGNLFLVNVMLVIFNLIPAFPMDGGRMLRAFLAMKFTRSKATRIAANIGQIIAILFIIMGIQHNPFLVLIGVFIFMSARSETVYETSRSALSDYKVRKLIMSKYTVLKHDDHLDRVVEVVLLSQEKEFIVAHNHKIVGVLTQHNIIQALSLKQNFFVHEIMNKEFPYFSPDMNLKTAYERLATNQSSIGPVIDNSQLIGILNMENIQEFLLYNRL